MLCPQGSEGPNTTPRHGSAGWVTLCRAPETTPGGSLAPHTPDWCVPRAAAPVFPSTTLPCPPPPVDASVQLPGAGWAVGGRGCVPRAPVWGAGCALEGTEEVYEPLHDVLTRPPRSTKPSSRSWRHEFRNCWGRRGRRARPQTGTVGLRRARRPAAGWGGGAGGVGRRSRSRKRRAIASPRRTRDPPCSRLLVPPLW